MEERENMTPADEELREDDEIVREAEDVVSEDGQSEDSDYDDEIEAIIRKNKKTKRIVLIAFGATLVLLLICAMIPGLLFGNDSEYKEYEPVDPSKLYETKEEDFDIMEYEEYLSLDRNVYFHDGTEENYTKTGIDSDDAAELGEDILLAYQMIDSIINGDVDGYNALVADKLVRDSFTQQQLYSISLRRERPNEGYDYAVRVEYKIHENNGSYRNNIMPDSSRYQIYCMKNEDGALKVVDILEPYFEKYDPNATGSCSSALGGGAVAVIVSTVACVFTSLKKKED